METQNKAESSSLINQTQNAKRGTRNASPPRLTPPHDSGTASVLLLRRLRYHSSELVGFNFFLSSKAMTTNLRLHLDQQCNIIINNSAMDLKFRGIYTKFGNNSPFLCKPISCILSNKLASLSLSSQGVQLKRVLQKTRGFAMVSCSGSESSGGLTYKDAGVDIDSGSELVRRIAKMAPGIGGFGGLFPLGDSYLVAGTDGVGTKLKLAFETGIHETIGIDLVAMSVNDIVTSGAKPLFFLDYFATSHLDVDLAERVIKGIVDGCVQSDCALLGGETAEMPGFYAEGEYDLSGFAVGIVKKDSVIDGKNIEAGDVLIGLPSSGVHSNGFSLVRRVLAQSGNSLNDEIPGGSVTLGEALMAPTVIYVKQVLDLLDKGGIKGIAHITGGGFTDNIPRVFPKGLGAVIDTNAWPVLPVFKWIQEVGRIDDAEMRRTFNLGIGMVLVVSPDAALRILGDANGSTPVYHIGEVVRGEGVSYR